MPLELPVIFWLKLMVLYTSHDGLPLLSVFGKGGGDAVLVVVEAVAGHLVLDGGTKTFHRRVGTPWLRLTMI